MNLRELFTLQFMMFVEMILGYVLCRMKILLPKERSVFSRAVVNLFLPCNIINSFIANTNTNVMQDFLVVLIISIFIQIFCTALANILYNKKNPDQKPTLQYATVCSNAGFLGNAVAEGVYGDIGLLYGQIYLIPLRIVMWTAGISYFEGRTDFKSKIKKIVTHPCIIAVVIGIILMLTGIRIPSPISKTISTLGKCSTPLIMIFLGMVLSESGFKSILSKETLLFSILRLIVIPGAALIGCFVFGVDELITGVSVLLAAMPAGSTTSVLAEHYKVDVPFASNIVISTTIGSIMLLPVWVLLLKYI